MSKVISFAERFPSTHIRKGEPTFFVEKLWRSLGTDAVTDGAASIAASFTDLRKDTISDYVVMQDIQTNRIHSFAPKYHTIRRGERFSVGDMFSPRVWTGKPYCSKQKAISTDLEVEQVYPIRILVLPFCNQTLQAVITINGKDFQDIDRLAKNDGLSRQDFLHWFKDKKNETFVGQIICWSNEIIY